MMKNRKWIMAIACFLVVFAVSVSSSCGFSSADAEMPDIEVDRGNETSMGEMTEEEFEELLENRDFLETFDTFYYPDSTVKDTRAISDGQDMIYVVLETDEAYDAVEEHYKSKKVQSIWNRNFIYKKSTATSGSESDDGETASIQLSRFTFSSNDMDKVVDIVIKELSASRTQIMITFWNL